MPRCKYIEQVKAPQLNSYDHLIIFTDKPLKKNNFLSSIPKPYTRQLKPFLEARQKGWKDDHANSFDVSPSLGVTYVSLSKKMSAFEALTLARSICASYESAKRILCDLNFTERAETFVDAIVSAHVAAWDYKKPAVKEKTEAKSSKSLTISCDKKYKKVLQRAEMTAAGTCLMRELFETPANYLDCKALRDRAQKEAKEIGAKFEFIGRKKLESLGAGAFLAVARGSEHLDAGIAKLTHGSKTDPHLILVGKGVVYDTGGTNLKPAQYMFGMQGDMGGSALALSLFKTIVNLNLPIRLSCYLAISDNAIDAKAYRPNEVVKTIKGTTIETVHTDAEGRMLLVDTLAIACKEDYDLIMDFATLTGSCVAAIGTTYSGVFTNREKLNDLAISAGKESGERLWPFPMDEDFFEPLKSEIADIKQCLLKGGVDHIEAAQLLQQFVRKDKPWIHIDLSAAENEGGLAHIPENVTGFGVRVGLELVERALEI